MVNLLTHFVSSDYGGSVGLLLPNLINEVDNTIAVDKVEDCNNVPAKYVMDELFIFVPCLSIQFFVS